MPRCGISGSARSVVLTLEAADATARVHHPCRRHCGVMAPGGARAAGRADAAHRRCHYKYRTTARPAGQLADKTQCPCRKRTSLSMLQEGSWSAGSGAQRTEALMARSALPTHVSLRTSRSTSSRYSAFASPTRRDVTRDRPAPTMHCYSIDHDEASGNFLPLQGLIKQIKASTLCCGCG
jgi:hypothetical protein